MRLGNAAYVSPHAQIARVNYRSKQYIQINSVQQWYLLIPRLFLNFYVSNKAKSEKIALFFK